MGIYSLPKSSTASSNNEVNTYVRESFLESCIDETASNILDEIYNINTESVVELFESMLDLHNRIENSTLNTDTKQSLYYSLIEHVYSNINEDTIKEEDLLSESGIESILEFDGNDKKNQEFIKLLKDIDTLTQKNLEKIKKCISDLEKYQHWADDIVKNPNKLSSYITKIEKDNKEFNAWLEKNRVANGPKTFAELRKKARTFNNKYSEVVMGSKKEVSAKFDKVEKEMNRLITPWVSKNDSTGKAIGNLVDTTNKIIDEIDRTNGIVFQRRIRQIYDYALDEAEWTLEDIDAFRKVLDIEFENKKMYKFVNAFIKSKKK